MGVMEIVSGVSAIFFPLKNLRLSSKDNSIERNLCKEAAGRIIFIHIYRSRLRPGEQFGIFTSMFVILNTPKMKVPKLIQSIEELVKLADKEFYYRENNLQLRFSSRDSVIVIGTREDGTVYLSVYYGSEMGFKFYMEKDGTLLMEEGSMPGLLEHSGPDQILNLIDDSGEFLLGFGAEAIEWGNYEFKTMDQVREEFEEIKQADKKNNRDPELH